MSNPNRPRIIGFNSDRFVTDLMRLARERGMAYTHIARHVGFDTAILSRFRRGSIPDGITLAAICKWGGLNAADYSTEQPAEISKDVRILKDKGEESRDHLKALEVA